MKKTLIFGCGNRLPYYLNRSKNRRFVGIIDNDESRVGEIYCGLKVFSVNDVSKLDFDEVCVVISDQSVRQQLIDMKVNSEQIFYPARDELVEPAFTSAPFRQSAERLLCELTQHFRSAGVVLYSEFGTALGMFRSGQIIAHDDDIDVTVLRESATEEQVAALCRGFQSHEFGPTVQFSSSVDRAGSPMWSLTLPSSSATLGMYFRESIGGGLMRCGGESFTDVSVRHFVEPVEHAVDFGVVNLPFETDAYLTSLYGSQWRTPTRAWSYQDYGS